MTPNDNNLPGVTAMTATIDRNSITLESLTSLPFAMLCDALTAQDLYEFDQLLDNEKKITDERRKVVDALIVRRFGDRAKAQMTAERKDTGTIHIAASNTLNITVEVPKTVKWDQPILRQALAAMSPDDARHYGKVDIKVDEAKFKAAPPAVQTALSRARTVVPGKMKFTFAAADIEQEAA